MQGQGQSQVKERERLKVKSRQRKHNLNRNYNLMGFDTIEINLVSNMNKNNCPKFPVQTFFLIPFLLSDFVFRRKLNRAVRI